MSVRGGYAADTDPSRLKPSHERKLLGLLYRRYKRQYGHISSRLDEVSMATTEQPDELQIQITPGETWFPVTNLAVSLEKQGLVEFNESRTSFSLTPLGFREASKSKWDRILDWLNRNPGFLALIAIAISIWSLICGGDS